MNTKHAAGVKANDVSIEDACALIQSLRDDPIENGVEFDIHIELRAGTFDEAHLEKLNARLEQRIGTLASQGKPHKSGHAIGIHTKGSPGHVTRGSPGHVTRGSPGHVTRGSPGHVTR